MDYKQSEVADPRDFPPLSPNPPYNVHVSAAPISLDDWLSAFGLDPFLFDHIAVVLAALPHHVREDLVTDPSFVLCDYEPSHEPAYFRVATPGKRPGRSVILKRTLRRRPETFVRWVIAHELAHAHLRNGGRHPGEDPEHAADSLAADWGFPRPG